LSGEHNFSIVFLSSTYILFLCMCMLFSTILC
jgi:hypothetical protein